MRKRLRKALRALLDHLIEVEVIGQEECPMMLRWQFLNLGFVKAMIHYFPPEVSDRDPHDHPRSFLTFVLRGRYRDESWHQLGGELEQKHGLRLSHRIVPPEGIRRVEHVCAGAVKFRAAEHLHIVETDEVGCWTLVVMGPVKRDWGFVRVGRGASLRGKWLPFKTYIDQFGGVARCDAPPGSAAIFSETPVEDQIVPTEWVDKG